MFYIDPLSILLFCRYARQVAAFFEFVKKKKEDPTHKVDQAAKSNQPNLLLPNNGGFWVPNGKHFPGLPLESLDFRRAMPSISGQCLCYFLVNVMDPKSISVYMVGLESIGDFVSIPALANTFGHELSQAQCGEKCPSAQLGITPLQILNPTLLWQVQVELLFLRV